MTDRGQTKLLKDSNINKLLSKPLDSSGTPLYLRISGLYSRKRSKPHPNAKSVLGMTLNCVWQKDSTSDIFGSVAYSISALTPGSTLTRSNNICQGLIYGLNWSICKLSLLDRNTRYITMCKIINKQRKYVNTNIQCTQFSNLLA